MIKYLIITAAGSGSRMASVTNNGPKELILINDIPILIYSIEEGIAAGIKQIIIVINERKKYISDFFSHPHKAVKISHLFSQKIIECKNRANIIFVIQKKYPGEIGAIHACLPIVKDNAFAVIYPDELHFPLNRKLRSLSLTYDTEQKDIVALTSVTQDNYIFIGNSGKVKVAKYKESILKILKFLPKTRETGFLLQKSKDIRSCGYMIYHDYSRKHINSLVKESHDEYFDILLRNNMIENGREVLGYLDELLYFDLGNPIGYKHCIDFFGN